ncbi:MAG: TetR/AcrR family transcriptional regulator [Nevskia sp.]|nr:TetR/AcrR family transcriptional regulator [Nevskia sp.]
MNAATALMIEKGADVTMTEIAKRADLVIGSLYQYFSDKSEIHRAILLQHQTEVRQMLYDHASQVQTVDQFEQAMEQAFEKYFVLHQQDPLFNAIWSIVQTDAELQRLDIEDSLQNGRYLQSIYSRFLPHVSPERLVAGCALITQLALATARFARGIPPNLARHTKPTFRAMIRDAFKDLKNEDAAARRRL